MATRLSQLLLWPTLILRQALSWQPGMPVHSHPLLGPLVTVSNACTCHLCGSSCHGMMLAHALCWGPLVAARHACMLPPEQAAELLLWYMQWSRDLAAEMHRRHLVWDKARRTDSLPISYRPCDCAA